MERPMQEDKVFADILQECLEAAVERRGSVQDCLARYPQHAPRLEALLHLGAQVSDLPLRAQRPETLAAGERRLLQAARARAGGGCIGRLRSTPVWLACGAAVVLSWFCLLVCVIAILLIAVIKPSPLHPPLSPLPTATRTVAPTGTATGSPAPTSSSPMATPTPTLLSPILTPTPTVLSPVATPTPVPVPPTSTPQPTATPIPPTPTRLPPTSTPAPAQPTPARQPKPSLGFHPDELRADGCATSYRTTGALKNHGGEAANWAANVQIGHQVVKGAEYVARVVVSPDSWPVIAGDETVNYTIVVDTSAAWQDQRDREIKVRLYIAGEDNRPGHHQTQAHFTIVNRCP
jgi:hypothetical protein